MENENAATVSADMVVTASENQAVDVTEKEKKSEKRKPADKLEALRAEHEKRVKAAEAAQEKAKAIEDKIRAEERKLHEKDIKRLDNICRDNNISYSDIIGFIELMTENNLTLKDVTDLIGTK